MSYLAIARKWRPSRFEDLVGQTHVVQTLKNAIQYKRVAHAYLFSGARGVGKTSVARIFAMALRCPNVKDAVPCTQCDECKQIADSRSVDVVEIDGASNNGVESVRGIRENVAYSASSGNYKIYIIDEVHMLSLSAFNALLKTLEEPPPHVIFIFATTEVQKIPLTILSRCQRFEFKRLSTKQMVERLSEILAAESINLSEGALQALASNGDGSLRDSLSLLDQVLSYYSEQSQDTLEEEQVAEALGLSDSNTVLGFLSAVLDNQAPKAVELLGEAYQSGSDLKRFGERVLEQLRLVYLIRLGQDENQPVTADQLDISSGRIGALEALASRAPLVRLERMAQILGKSVSQLNWASLPRFVLEMATVRMTKLEGLEQLERGALTAQEPVQESTEVSVEEPEEYSAEQTAPTPPAKGPEPQPVAAAPARPAAQEPNRATPPPVSFPSPRSTEGPKTWKSFVDGVMRKRPLLGALLCHAEFKAEKNDNEQFAVLTFPEGSFYERQAVDNKNRTEINAFIKQYFGEHVVLRIDSAHGDQIASIEKQTNAEIDRQKKQALEHPTVIKMQEMGAQVVDVNVGNVNVE